MEYQPALPANETEKERRALRTRRSRDDLLFLSKKKKLLEVKLRIDKFEASWKKVSKPMEGLGISRKNLGSTKRNFEIEA